MKLATLPAGIVARLMFGFGFGFFLSMFSRTLSNIVKQPIQLDLGLSEQAISLALSASFFMTFALAQLPIGILLDRFDTRKVNASLFLIAASGAVVVAYSNSGTMLTTGRVLMGLGFAAAMMGSLKTYSLWFPLNRLPTINSLQFMIGVLGSFSATKPTELLLRVMDWRDLYLLFASITLLAAAFMVTFTPRHKGQALGETLGQQLQGLLKIYTDGFFWRIAPWTAISLGVAQGLNTLYVFSWMTDVGDYTTSQAASGVAVVTLVAAVTYAIMGPLAERMDKRGISPLTMAIVGQCLAMVFLAVLSLQIKIAITPQWAVWMMMTGTTTLVFAAVSRAFPPQMIGRAYAALNLLGFMTTAGVQWLVGFTLDIFPRTEQDGAAPDGYQLAFFLLLGLQFTAACWYMLAKRFSIGRRTMLEKHLS